MVKDAQYRGLRHLATMLIWYNKCGTKRKATYSRGDCVVFMRVSRGVGERGEG
jgi:hypothetical protein